MKIFKRAAIAATMALGMMAIPTTAANAQEAFIGEVRIFPYGGSWCPRNWARMDGSLLPISQNTALFSLLGTTYGGDGRSTFALPDLRGRVPMHNGNGPGLTQRQQGQMFGMEESQLIEPNLPPHSHSMNASSGGPSSNSPSGAAFATYPSTPAYNTGGATDTPMESGTIGDTGAGVPFNNIQPVTVLNYCIATQGLYPSRN